MSFRQEPDRAQHYASMHSNFDEYMWSHDAGKVWYNVYEEKTITQTTILQKHAFCACVESSTLFSMIHCLF